MREHLWSTGLLYSKVAEGKENEGANFRDWFDFNEPLRKLPSHRILALCAGASKACWTCAWVWRPNWTPRSLTLASRALQSFWTWGPGFLPMPTRAAIGSRRFVAGPGASSEGHTYEP